MNGGDINGVKGFIIYRGRLDFGGCRRERLESEMGNEKRI